MVDMNTSLQDLFEIVIRTLDDVKTGESFIVKELFRGFEWNRIKKGNRTKLGSMLPYAITAAIMSFVAYAIVGPITYHLHVKWFIMLPIFIAMMVLLS